MSLLDILEAVFIGMSVSAVWVALFALWLVVA
jgi:hypothetical protein